MQIKIKHHNRFKNKNIAFLSLLSGLSLSLFLYTYWLIDFFPPLSKTIFALTAIISLVGSIAYFLLYTNLIIPVFLDMGKSFRIKLISSLMVMSLFVAWFGLEGMIPDSRYLVFLLPRQTLKISVPQPQQSDLTGSKIYWLKTSLGEVSFNTWEYVGWERIDDALVLNDPINNHLEWSGQTGKEAVIVFKTSPEGGIIKASWNGVEKELNLLSGKEDDLIYRNLFNTPLYASRGIPLAFGLFNILAGFFVLSSIICRSKEGHKNELGNIKGSLEHHAWQRIDLYLMLGLIGAALLLRVFNLENLYPFADEYSHLLAAKNILSGLPLSQVYQRSLFIVSLPVTLFIKIFGAHIWAARLATVIFNSLAVIPLYLITRRINKPVAVIACILFATSPWVIAVARNIREYGYYPFYFYWILYGMFLFLERLPEKIVLIRDWKKVLKPGTIALLLILVFPIIYSRFIDLSSTFRTVLPAYFVFSLFLIKKLDWKNKANAWLIILIIILMLLGYMVFLKDLNISPNFVTNLSAFLGYFFKNSEMQWFYGRTPILLGLVLGAAFLASIYSWKYTSYPIFFVGLFFSSAILFILKFNHYFRPRYFFHLQIWYIPAVALGSYSLWVLMRLFIKAILLRLPVKQRILEDAALYLASAALILNINFQQTFLPSFYKENGFMPITTEYHYNVKPVHEYILAHAVKEDILIYTIYGSYANWVGEPEFAGSYYYDITRKDKKEYILSLVDKNPSGWIVIDKWKGVSHSRLLPLQTFSSGGKEVVYIGELIDEHVWRW